jgi:hypothetical protein
VEVAKLFEMPGNYGKSIIKKYVHSSGFNNECVCDNLHAGSNESL